MKKYRFIFILYLCVFLLSSCEKHEAALPIVEVENVATGDFEIYSNYVGLIEPSGKVEIHARVEGFLEKVTFQNGKRIAAGQPLFYINNAPYKARVEKAKAQLLKDEAVETKARRDLERLRPLYEQNAVSRLDLDNAEAALNVAKATVSMSKADLAQTELQLSYTVVSSPLSGYISANYGDIGTLVGGSGSSLLATVVKSDTVGVSFKLSALDYLRSQRRNVHLGELDTTRSWQPTVTITLADNSVYAEKGIVDFADPQVDPHTGTFGVSATIPNPNQILLPGQYTRVKLMLDMMENVIIVPRKAISIEKGGAFIYVIRPDSIAEKRFVEVGAEHNNNIVVVRGLSVAEKIVTEGFQKLTQGQKVIPRTRDEELKVEAQEKENQKKEGQK
ncbi:efflux RND transporter periplasmic adaptor subunit [Dysgonomonas sp. 216]|uniref:efflux RND transporter periplasmic adaptor subunit n=1 Tax=Dysgonomonas sp. 216 TaxID=2302934 RepID=UPI0013D378A3|nr:efflux RND transporter periplasmic adaptor subunit [Dysgonomonas sp. 216]NDW19341.1 efflux RND transporter periplasmic adaptor subunit [Dysgonomonas sp. 216]